MPTVQSPAPAAASRRLGLARTVAATRPGFLSITAVACLLGLAAAWYERRTLAELSALATLAGALLAHAAANVLNDLHDARNGGDAINVDRVAPYTGGSRFIQDGLLDERATARLAAALFAAVVPFGALLLAASGPGLLVFGAAGLLLAWAYSAPPLALMSRGLGEPAVALAWWLVVAGSAFVQSGSVGPAAAVAGAGFALSVAMVLFVNQFPDARADAAVGKRNWVVRAGPGRARAGAVLLALAAQAVPAAGVAAGWLPAACLAGALALAPAWFAARQVARHAGEPHRLAPAIRATIAAAHLHGLLLAAGLVAAAR